MVEILDLLVDQGLAVLAWEVGVVVVSVGLLLATSGMVVRFALEQAGEEYGKAEDTGRVIGKAENILVVLIMLFQAYTALALIFAGKSIVRTEDLDSGDTTIVLAGTLVNFTYSMIWGGIAAFLVGLV